VKILVFGTIVIWLLISIIALFGKRE